MVKDIKKHGIMQAAGKIHKIEAVTIRATQSQSNVTWDVPSSIAEKGLLVQHMLSHLKLQAI